MVLKWVLLIILQVIMQCSTRIVCVLSIMYGGCHIGLTVFYVKLAYCTGLLLARRVLKMLKMDEEYQGNLEVLFLGF